MTDDDSDTMHPKMREWSNTRDKYEYNRGTRSLVRIRDSAEPPEKRVRTPKNRIFGSIAGGLLIIAAVAFSKYCNEDKKPEIEQEKQEMQVHPRPGGVE